MNILGLVSKLIEENRQCHVDHAVEHDYLSAGLNPGTGQKTQPQAGEGRVQGSHGHVDRAAEHDSVYGPENRQWNMSA